MVLSTISTGCSPRICRQGGACGPIIPFGFSVFRKKEAVPENRAVGESDNFHAGIFIITFGMWMRAYGLLGNSKNRS
jgi:hypothetical protein